MVPSLFHEFDSYIRSPLQYPITLTIHVVSEVPDHDGGGVGHQLARLDHGTAARSYGPDQRDHHQLERVVPGPEDDHHSPRLGVQVHVVSNIGQVLRGVMGLVKL